MPTTTLTLANAFDGQRVRTVGSVWPPTANLQFLQDTYASATKQLQTPNYAVYNGLLRWDTSSISDAALVTAATLRLYCVSRYTIDARSIVAEWYTWDGVSGTDETATEVSNAHSGTLCTALTASADNDFALLSVGTYVNRTGYTYIRLHCTGGTPTNISGADFAAYGNTSGTAARLIVTYTDRTRMAPDAIISQTNLTGAVTAVQDNPDAPDASWLIAP